jgi:hypothetical protein
MLFASLMSDALLWMIVLGVAANAALNRMFGPDWPKQAGDGLRVWWANRVAKAAKDEPQDEAEA